MRRSVLTCALLCAALLALLAAPLASAKPEVGPDGPSFYAPPTKKAPKRHGTLLRYRPTSISLGATAPQAWNLIYRSRSARDKPNAVAGTAFVPTAPWEGEGARPIVSFTVGTQGLDESCAPSRQFEAGSEYENSNISAALDRGWAVLVTDYEGYLDGQTPTYSAGRSQGHAALDIVRAARKIPGAGLSRKAKVAIWGYSQGGQSAAWAGEQERAYTPEAKVRGIVAGGVPANLRATAENLDGNVGAGLLLAATVGVDRAYPKQFRLASRLNAAGAAAVEQVKGQCVGETLATYAGRSLSEFTRNGETLDEVVAGQGDQARLPAQPARPRQAEGPGLPVPLEQRRHRAARAGGRAPRDVLRQGRARAVHDVPGQPRDRQPRRGRRLARVDRRSLRRRTGAEQLRRDDRRTTGPLRRR